MGESILCFTERPAFLKYGFNLLRVFANTLGLLPFRQREIKWITRMRMLKSFRHCPAVFQKQFTGQVEQSSFGERKLYRFHFISLILDQTAWQCLRPFFS
ncbi:MAG TPA: hypothetical protein VFI43_01670 [Nitrosospira sp.]|nr:hypothetical protein [Nitrosospira sp.]